MKKTIILILVTLLAMPRLMAQSAAVKKVAEAAFTLTTFKNDGSIVGTASGVFIDGNGTAVSPWKPFEGADYAVVIDAKGRRHQVDAIYGANEIYDLAKFCIADKSPAFAKATTSRLAAGSRAWLIPNKQSDSPQPATVKTVETFMNRYAYYVVEVASSRPSDMSMYEGCPVATPDGTLLGLYHVSTSNQSVTDAHFAEVLMPDGMTQNQPTLRQTAIRTALPAKLSDARLAMMFAGERGGANYRKTVDEFVSMFPKQNDGYYARALLSLNDSNITAAEADMKTAVREADDKAEAHYNYSRILAMTGKYDQAISEAKAAYAVSPLPVYQEQEASILFDQGKYQQAYDMFISLTRTDMHKADLYYKAMRSRQQLGGTDDELLALLDSAVEACDTPYTSMAAPYFLARGVQHDKMKQYRKAMSDLYTYEALAVGQVGAAFYHLRAQSEARGRIYQPALDDYARAIVLDPKNLLYWAELASLTLKVGEKENAAKAAQRCIELDPSYPDAYLILGIVQAETGKKAEGIRNIEKAKELGNAQADSFLKKYK